MESMIVNILDKSGRVIDATVIEVENTTPAGFDELRKAIHARGLGPEFSISFRHLTPGRLMTCGVDLTEGELDRLARQFPLRDSRGYVIGVYVYEGYGARQSRHSGPYPDERAAQQVADHVPESSLIVGHIFTSNGSIIRAPHKHKDED